MINAEHLRLHIIRPVLEYLDPLIPYSMAAENQLIGTCAQESHMGEFLVQLGGGPALGIYQMEPATHDDIYDNFLMHRPELSDRVNALASRFYSVDHMELVGNLYYATAMARVHYWRVPWALPEDNVEQLANYWKLHWNTHLGAGTEQQFIDNYQLYVV